MSEIKNDKNMEMKAFSLHFETISNMKEHEITQWTDDRGFNLLMVASETGRLDVVEFLLSRGLNVNFEVKNQTAVSLAFEKGHQEVVLALLKANSRYPPDFNGEEATDELKNFVELSENLHNKIKERDEENFEEILRKNPTLRHHYDAKNNSALKIAIISAMFSIVEVLLRNNIYLGPHEEMDDIIENLSRSSRRKLRDLHLQLSPHIFSDTMMALMRNCRFGPDSRQDPEYMVSVSRAFHFLLEIPQIAIILKIVAATREFILVFDFNREWTSYIDPLSEPYTNGLFYLSGKIYIGAKHLLDPERCMETYSIIAHELCHFCMFLVFNNDAKAYHIDDHKSKENFNRIVQECQENMDSEEIVSSVFDCYHPTMQHAELVVRPPQMLVFYHKKEELNERRKAFPKLFNNFEQNVVPAMEKALPSIKKKFRPNIEKKVEKLQKWLIFLAFIIIFGSMVAIYGANKLYDPPTSFEALRNDDKMIFNNSNVTYHGVSMRFSDLFANNSEVYDLISSEDIKSTINGNTVELSKKIATIYEQFVLLTWSNATKVLRDKILTTNVTFQGAKIPLKEIASYSALNLLNSIEIRSLISGRGLNISKPIENSNNFYINRTFIEEDRKPNSFVRNFQQVFEEVEQSKIFLLSNSAGEGKSTTYRNFAYQLKEKHPDRWVEFVDLKRHIKAFKDGKKMKLLESEVFTRFLSDNLLALKGFDREVFNNRFTSNNTIFLFDGVDEISPQFNDLIVAIFAIFKGTTSNIQYISTRPQHSKRLSSALGVQAFKLIPLSEEERWNFLVKLITLNTNKNCSNSTNCASIISSKLKRATEIFKAIETSEHSNQFLTNPILIFMIAENLNAENFDETISVNLFKLYEFFIDKKLKIVDNKGEIVLQDVHEIDKSRTINLFQVHQAFAIKLILEPGVDLFSNPIKLNELTVMNLIPESLKFDVSRYGILLVISIDDFNFIHRTFGEFFVAQYLLDTISMNGKSEEILCQVQILLVSLFTDRLNVVKNIMTSSIDFQKLMNLLFIKLEKSFKKSQILELFLYSYKFTNDQVFPIHAVSKYTVEELNIWLKFIEKTFNDDEQKQIFSLKTSRNPSVLEYATYNKNPGVFEVIHNIHEKLFNRSQICDLLYNPAMSRSFIFRLIENSNLKMIQYYSKYIFYIFENEKGKLQNLLTLRNPEGDTIFLLFKDKGEKLGIFRNLLRKAFDNEVKFNKLYEISLIKSYAAHWIQKLFRNFTEEFGRSYLNEAIAFDWTNDDLRYVVEGWEFIEESIGKESFGLYLSAQGDGRQTILHELFGYVSNEKLMVQLLNKMKLNLGEDRMRNLIFTTSYDNITSLMEAARSGEEIAIKVYLNFTENILSKNDLKNILKIQLSNSHTALNFALRNKKSSTNFSTFGEIYSRNFNKKELQDFIITPSLVADAIQNASDQKFSEFVKFLKTSSTDSTHLRAVFNAKYSNGDTLLDRFKNNKRFKYFKEIIENL